MLQPGEGENCSYGMYRVRKLPKPNMRDCRQLLNPLYVNLCCCQAPPLPISTLAVTMSMSKVGCGGRLPHLLGNTHADVICQTNHVPVNEKYGSRCRETCFNGGLEIAACE